MFYLFGAFSVLSLIATIFMNFSPNWNKNKVSPVQIETNPDELVSDDCRMRIVSIPSLFKFSSIKESDFIKEDLVRNNEPLDEQIEIISERD